MQFIRSIVTVIDTFTETSGKALAWLCLAMMLTTTATVFMRYGLNIGSVMLQESTLYMHASLFMLGSAYTLKHNAHVRVDVFFRNFSPRVQAWVNLGGSIFLLMPVMAFIAWTSWDYVSSSWSIRESSSEPGGIPAVFLLKSLLPAMVIVLLLQALAEALRSILIICGPQTIPTQGEHGD